MQFHPLKSMVRGARRLCSLVAGGALLLAVAASAFPPAPYHTLYGLVRNEYGEPISVSGAKIIFQSTNGVQVAGNIVPGLEPGINYRLNLPMDSGIAPDNYKPTALKPTLPFTIRVTIGDITYLPMEVVGKYQSLGKPAQSTRLDLTLGVDADHDGLPDAWQQLIRTVLGANAKTGPNDDPDGDGISNLNEYLLGTYAFIPDGGLRLTLVMQEGGKASLAFAVTPSRTYKVFRSTDLQTWVPQSFKIQANGEADPVRGSYTASDTRILQVEPQIPGGVPNASDFFKVQVE